MRYRRARQTAWRTIAEETIVLDLTAKRMYGFNATAAFVWQTLETFDNLPEMLRAMGATRADPPIEAVDIETFLLELISIGLIEQAETAKRRPVALELPETLEPPRIEWRETVEQIAATCAFFPAQNPLCTQVPFS